MPFGLDDLVLVERDDARLDGLAQCLSDGCGGYSGEQLPVRGQTDPAQGVSGIRRDAELVAQSVSGRCHGDQSGIPARGPMQEREILPLAVLLRIGETGPPLRGVPQVRLKIAAQPLEFRRQGNRTGWCNKIQHLVPFRVEPGARQGDLGTVRGDHEDFEVCRPARKIVVHRIEALTVGFCLANQSLGIAEATAVEPHGDPSSRKSLAGKDATFSPILARRHDTDRTGQCRLRVRIRDSGTTQVSARLKAEKRVLGADTEGGLIRLASGDWQTQADKRLLKLRNGLAAVIEGERVGRIAHD
ncbi:hypothetical protein LT988_17355 [Thiocapsa bogorovii]|nr:hypothetical protein [Thiocapsa bogorovii]UHD15037.1 hypothetical protein LT988_17355 [Thiocapsa bogorovii]